MLCPNEFLHPMVRRPEPKDDLAMNMTTGAILRRITETDLSVSAHKLATVILDGIAWKDGYNGLDRGTAAFTLAHLAEKMGVSRQHLTNLLAELSESALALARWKPNGKFAPWLFRFRGSDDDVALPDVVSATSDTSLFRELKNKTIFSGRIEIDAKTNVYHTPWAEMIKAAKTSLACWNVDTQAIWDRFVAFNKARGNDAVPAGFLLGFMRNWRNSSCAGAIPTSDAKPQRMLAPAEQELHRLIAAVPSKNREFHASDLCRLIGQAAYDARIRDVVRKFGCPRFTATLAVHASAVAIGEISR
jgi:DNA-binding IscR family transcriptional regulator